MRSNSIRGTLSTVALYLLLRVGAQMVVLRSPAPWLAISLTVASIAVFMFLQLSIIRGASGLQMRPRVTGLLIPVFALVVAALSVLLGTIRMPGIAVVAIWALRDLGLMFFAVSLGYTLSFIVREPNILLPVAIFAALIDFWSVTVGPLAMLLAKRPEVVQAAAVQMPAVGYSMPIREIGVGDFVFLALYFGVMYRYRMNVSGAFRLGFALLTLTMVLVIMVPALAAVPGLVPIGIAVIGANTRHIKLKRDEVLSTVIVGVILLVLLILSVVLLLKGR